MRQSKIIQFIQTLSPLEINRFEKFVHSPYHNMHKDTIRLFTLLKKAYPDFPEKKIKPEKLFTKLYPKEAFQIGKLHTLNKYLSQLFVEFISLEHLQEHGKTHLHRTLIEAMADRRLHKFIHKPLEQAAADYEAYPYRDGTYFYNQFRLQKIRSELILNQDNRAIEAGLQHVSTYLDAFYLTKKLHYACAIVNRQKFLKEKSDIKLLEEIKSYCQGLEVEENPVVYMYYQSLLMLQNEEEAPYRKLSHAIGQYYALIPRDEAISLYSLMINFSNMMYKRGEKEYLKEMFEIYRKMLERDLLFISLSTAAIHYKNLVSLALKLKEYEWGKQFMLDYKCKLDPANREDIFNYNLANLYFHQADYRQTIRHLHKVEFSEAFHRLNYQLLLLKSYYECKEIEPLYSLCNTFSMYVRRHKSLSDNNKQAHLSMAKFLRRIAKIEDGGKKNLNLLIKEIETCEFLVERKWLLAKVQVLSK